MEPKNAIASRLQIKLREREHRALRLEHGPRLAAAMGMLVGREIGVQDFCVQEEVPFAVVWPERIESAPGLVAAYVPRDQIVRILDCIAHSLGSIGGSIGVHQNEYLGLHKSERVQIGKMLPVAERIDDSVVFYPIGMKGAIIVDCYRSNPGFPYSLIVQGPDLVPRFEGCFH